MTKPHLFDRMLGAKEEEVVRVEKPDFLGSLLGQKAEEAVYVKKTPTILERLAGAKTYEVKSRKPHLFEKVKWGYDESVQQGAAVMIVIGLILIALLIGFLFVLSGISWVWGTILRGASWIWYGIFGIFGF